MPRRKEPRKQTRAQLKAARTKRAKTVATRMRRVKLAGKRSMPQELQINAVMNILGGCRFPKGPVTRSYTLAVRNEAATIVSQGKYKSYTALKNALARERRDRDKASSASRSRRRRR